MKSCSERTLGPNIPHTLTFADIGKGRLHWAREPSGRSEISPPDVDVADSDRDQHHRKGIERIGDKAERHALALAEPGHDEVGGGADQGAVAAETGAERQAPPERLDLVTRAIGRRHALDQRD